MVKAVTNCSNLKHENNQPNEYILIYTCCFFIVILYEHGIMKRRYMPGYYVSKSTKAEGVNKNVSKEVAQAAVIEIERAGSEQRKDNEAEINPAASAPPESVHVPETSFEERVPIVLQHSDAAKKRDIGRPGSRNAGDANVDGFAIASFLAVLLGIAALFFLGKFIWGVGLIIIGISIGIASLKRIRTSPESLRGRGFAIAGILLGILTLVFLALMILFIIALFI